LTRENIFFRFHRVGIDFLISGNPVTCGTKKTASFIHKNANIFIDETTTPVPKGQELLSLWHGVISQKSTTHSIVSLETNINLSFEMCSSSPYPTPDFPRDWHKEHNSRERILRAVQCGPENTVKTRE
jgi:hypothetical protein